MGQLPETSDTDPAEVSEKDILREVKKRTERINIRVESVSWFSVYRYVYCV